jgi:integrase
MARPRKHNPLDLPARVYAHHGAFYYVHKSGEWEHLGTDVEEAKRRAKVYNDPGSSFGTMSYYLDLFLAHCDKRVAAKGLAERTRDDYKRDSEPLKKYFGKLTPAQVTSKAVQDYLDLGAELNRAVRANRERACLSACLSWLIRTDENCGIKVNPCMRQSGVKRNRETKREVYVEDAWYRAVYDASPKSVRGMMALVYRTLQRPDDILGWGPWNIVHKDGQRVLRNDQGKTGTVVDIAIDAGLDAVIRELQGEVPSISQPWLHTLKGEAYTYDGLCAIFRRVQAKVRKDIPGMPTWGFYDLKGKGATDLVYREGRPLELVQLLCGHKDKTTTEIYVKARWRETAVSNSRQIGA